MRYYVAFIDNELKCFHSFSFTLVYNSNMRFYVFLSFTTLNTQNSNKRWRHYRPSLYFYVIVVFLQNRPFITVLNSVSGS